MGRLCAVPNCPSGHDRDRTRRKHAGVRQVSLFTVPKRNNMASIWSRLLGLELSARHLVCELHFSKDAIKMEDEILLADGTIHRIRREKWALKEGAKPVAIAEKENIGCDLGIRNAHEEVRFAAASIGDVQTLSVPDASLVSDTLLTPCEASAVEVPHISKEIVLVDVETDNFANHPMETSSHFPSGVQEHNSFHREVNNQDDAFDFAGHLMETSVESSSSSSEVDGNIGAIDEEPMQLLIDDIVAHLKEKALPETWCWTTNRKDEDSITFVKIDAYSYEPTLRLIVYNDLSVTVCTADGKANVELDSTLSSIRSFQTLLDDMGTKIVCNGTGMQDERRHKYCTVFVRTGEYGKFVIAPRCNSC